MPLVLRDDLFLAHEPGPHHPENPGRLAAIHRELDTHPPAGLTTVHPVPVQQADLARIHSTEYLAELQSMVGRSAQLDADTSVSPRSVEAARLAAGAVVQAAQAVVSGWRKPAQPADGRRPEAAASDRPEGAFALVRPPGHHAETGHAMGFCLYNNVAIAAAHAVDELGCRRVLILDPDVHHGNGTQHSFWSRRDVLYVSSHRFPFYPGTGAATEVGEGPGLGYTVNLPLPEGAGDSDLLHGYQSIVDPIVRQFEPDLILVSAGFDTWHKDPLGGLAVTERGFSALFALFQSWAQAFCPGRIALALEGGYDPEGLVAGVRAALSALGGTVPLGFEASPSPAIVAMAERSRALLRPHWSILR